VIGPQSRYAGIEIATLTVVRDGQPTAVSYLRRRFIPTLQGAVTLVRHTVRQGDRVDNLTALYLNDPTRFWNLCDTNVVLRPTELTDTLGRVINVALPLFGTGGGG
jgi:hypothetical protein